jgi:hypothetical protein
MKRFLSYGLALLLMLAPAACSDDSKAGDPAQADAAADTAPATDPGEGGGDEGSADTSTSGPTGFRFGVSRGQPMSSAPFPNDLYIGASGQIEIGKLGEDPVFSTLAKDSVLTRLDQHIAARTGFGFTSAIHFYMDGKPDLGSFDQKVHMWALSGPEAGKELEVEVFFFEAGGSLGVFPAFGHYMLPGSIYAVVVKKGVRSEQGTEIPAPQAFLDLLAAGTPTGAPAELTEARSAWEPLRNGLADKGLALEDLVVGTVFTTEPALDYARSLFATVDAYTLEPPTRRIRWDEENGSFVQAEPVEGEALETFFGTPSDVFQDTPGKWGDDARADAAALTSDKQPYSGGTLHKGIGRVLNGTFAAPAINYRIEDGQLVNSAFRFEGGAASWTEQALIPFTLFLCEDHLAAPTNLPVAIFTHGGTGIRADAVGYAAMNCQAGVATLSHDIPFHGGRTSTAYLTEEHLIAPTQVDEENTYSGAKSGHDDFVPDHIGENGGATVTVGGLYALPFEGDPMVMEANLLTIGLEAYALRRLAAEGDWSEVQADLSFDAARIFHQSISFGSTFTTVLAALDPGLRGVFTSVGSSMIMSANLTIAPSNAGLASNILAAVYGLESNGDALQRGAWRDPAIALIQWLSERGDSLGYAPYVLRYRETAGSIPVVASADSWDETLYTPAQITYNNAYGLPVYTAGDDFKIDESVPGAETVSATPFPNDPLRANASFGERSHTAALTYYSKSCHGQAVQPLCTPSYGTPQGPAPALEQKEIFASPVCLWQHQALAFLRSLLVEDPTGEIVAPAGSCEALYGN